MRVLFAHNYYLQPGGEDVVVDQEMRLLRDTGHDVVLYQRSNAELPQFGAAHKVVAAVNTAWSRRSEREILEQLRSFRPDVVHVHNTFAAISPSIYWACRKAGVPVVQTLHNYRLLCAAATFFRNNEVCTKCLSTQAHALVHKCYHNSRAQTAALVGTVALHRSLGTYHNLISAYIALTPFARDNYVRGGLPPERMHVKPNFLASDPGVASTRQDYAVFIGRLTREKGCLTLVQAWQRLPQHMRLKIIGDGPLREEIETVVRENGMHHVEITGRISRHDALEQLKHAAFLVFPSEWYELFPMTLLEAYACGVPVIASDSPAMSDIVPNGHVGHVFRSGDPDDLARTVANIWSRADVLAELGRNARREYEAKYTAAANYPMLMDIYARVRGLAAPAGPEVYATAPTTALQ